MDKRAPPRLKAGEPARDLYKIVGTCISSAALPCQGRIMASSCAPSGYQAAYLTVCCSVTSAAFP